MGLVGGRVMSFDFGVSDPEDEGGLWLLVIPLYSKRCVVCGTLPSEVATKASRALYSAAVTPAGYGDVGTLFEGIPVARSE